MVTIKTENINQYRAIKVGRAFYYAFKKFVRDPDNAEMIERRANEIRFEMGEDQSAEEREVQSNVH